MTIIKKCGIILGWRAGYPQRLVDNLWISRFGTRRLRFCTTFPLWRRRITLTLVTFPLWRRKSLWLNLRQGVSLKINWRKKWWGGISCICSKSLATEIICKSENLQFIFLKILCFNHFPIFSFWKKSPKVFFPQPHLVNVSRFDIYNYTDF